MKRLALALILFVLAAGCAAPQTQIWKESGVSLKNYHTLEVPAVANDTGKTFEGNFSVEEEFTESLRTRLGDQGFRLCKEGEFGDGVLQVKTSMVAYEPGSAFKRWLLPGLGASRCTVKVALLDRKTGKVLSEFVETGNIGGGGLFSIGGDRAVLGMVAKKCAADVAKLVKGE
jgi:hypothetical protein